MPSTYDHLDGSTVASRREGPVAVLELRRPGVRNAIDPATATALAAAIRAADTDPQVAVLVITGQGSFCAGADLHAVASGDVHRVEPDGDAPLGFARKRTTKPTIAAIEGHAVAGGLELALWCDLRVAARDAVLGVFCRRFGVPLIDGGTVRLPRLVGLSRALDWILTGRAVHAAEAHAAGLVQQLTAPGEALEAAIHLGHQLAAFPQGALRADLASARAAFDHPLPDALTAELLRGREVVQSGETLAGATQFHGGAGRHGDDP